MSRTSGMATLFTAAIMLLSGPVLAQSLLDPPFGLRWGDSPEKLITWAAQSELDVTITLPGKNPDMRIVKIAPQGVGFLPDTKATAVEGSFFSGKLFELAVHYADPDAGADTVDLRFQKLRKQINIEYGTLLTNQHQRTVSDQFVTRTQSFHREPVKGLFLLLAYTEVEDLLRKSKQARFSLIYRNDNYRQQLEAGPHSP